MTKISPEGASANTLSHLAVVIDGVAGAAGSKDGLQKGAVLLLERCRHLVADCFSVLDSLSVLSLFAPELQEWALDPASSSRLFDLCREEFGELNRTVRSLGAGLAFPGRLAELPDPWPELTSLSASSSELTRKVNFYMNYSGRDELASAVRRFLESRPVSELSETALSDGLYTAGQPDPDLIIFAGGELEPKDFLIWQASYAEIWHSPERGLTFTREKLEGAIRDYNGRQRRFGRVSS